MSLALASTRAALTPRFATVDLWRQAGAVPSLHVSPGRTSNLSNLVDGSSPFTFTRPGTALGWNGSQFAEFAADQPRAGVVDPATGDRGWLLEANAATNLINFSVSTAANRVRINTTTTDNAAPDAFGGNTMMRIVPTDSSPRAIASAGSATIGLYYCASVVFRPGEYTRMGMFFNTVSTNPSFEGQLSWFDAATETTGGTGRPLKFVKLGNSGAYLVWVTTSNPTTGATNLSPSVTCSDSSWNGDHNVVNFDGTSGAFFGHMQVEVVSGPDSTPTSPIITNGSPVTRAAEVCTINDPAAFNLPSTFYANCRYSPANGNNQFLFAVDSGSFSDEIRISKNATNSLVLVCTASGVNEYFTGEPDTEPPTPRLRHAFANALNNSRACLGGVLEALDTSVAPPATFTRGYIGARANDTFRSDPLFIRDIALWRTRLPDATLPILGS